jgi:hypothetical protein
MKTLLLFFLGILFFCDVTAQTDKEFLVIPCESGTLIIDGKSIGIIEANDVSRQTLSFGDHYIQLKTNTDKINLSVAINETTKNIIKIGCEKSGNINGVRLIDKQLSLAGLLSDTEENIIGLDRDDEIVVNSFIVNKKGTATIFISEINNGNEIYRNENFKILENEKIKITSKGIYKIVLYTDALFGKEAKLTIDRIPSKNSTSDFNTNPKIVFDTTYIEVLKTQARVYSAGNLNHPNKTAISINLPANTSYWTYWIGVDQEAQERMKEFTNNLSPAISKFSANPLVLYGMKLLPSLPIMNTPSTVNYKFMDTQGANNYISGQAYSYYKFKYADNVSTDYSLIKATSPDLVLAMENNSSLTGYNVEIRVLAFVIKSKLVL